MQEENAARMLARISVLQQKLQREADENKATAQVHLATVVVLATNVVSSQSVACQVHQATAIVISGMLCSGMLWSAVQTSVSFVKSR